MPIFFRTSNHQGGVHGMGIFADEDIPAGSIWRSQCEVQGRQHIPCKGSPDLPTIIYTEEQIYKELENVGQQQFAYILHRMLYYEDAKVLMWHRDGCDVTNHSFNPNGKILFPEKPDPMQIKHIALRDIKAGEEITQDYSCFSKRRNDWCQKLFQKHLPERLQFEVDLGIKSEREK